MESNKPPPLRPLCKQHSWSPDTLRDEAWQRRQQQTNYSQGRRPPLCRSSKSFSDDDLDELKACFDLGFGFNPDDIDPKLSDTFPALGFYCAVKKQYAESLSRSSSSSSIVSDSSVESPVAIFDSADHDDEVKRKLKQWAQIVACTVRESSSG